MAKKRQSRSRDQAHSVTADRVARLYRLIQLLAVRPLSRPQILRRLRLNQRGFYRDMELLRTAGIPVSPDNGQYRLELGFTNALSRLPFPDPQLTLGQAQELARGSKPAHQMLRQRLQLITRSGVRGAGKS